MSGNQTTITNPTDDGKSQTKKFAFDFSYWSHDGYNERPDGYLEPAKSQYADQKMVFDDLGLGVLDNAWKGYNCSLFAYGQTGSGKSYSMVGYGANKGIVPVACDELFKRIEAARTKAETGEEYQVHFSMLEIYNEQVRDLLNPASLKIKGGLKIRQHPNKGFYVEGLKNVSVNSYRDIDAKISEGTKNRTVASTNMNATSSRAHTVVAINFAQKKLNEAKKSMTKTSIINLVDLAGSERVDSSGATGDRLKEGSSINLSLSTLGKCIKALSESSSGKKSVVVPFRDSALTKLLKNALGGNSKTVMIAALSPADINYDETLSTLRFAERAKSVKTKAVVNESPTDKLIRELREENKRLMEQLAKGGGGGGGAGANEQELEEMRKQMDEEIAKNKRELEDMQKSWEQKVKDMEQQRDAEKAAEVEKKKKDEQRKVIPHFWNLNEDPSLTGMVVHFTPEGKTKIGNSKASPPADIQLNGLMIQAEHAVVKNKNRKVFLRPCKGAKITLNGNVIKEEKELHHNDRVLFGSNHLFVFHHPRDAELLAKKGGEPAADKPTYEDAQQEIAEQSGLTDLLGINPGKSKDDLLLHEDLVQLLPMVGEANAMSEELNKKANFEVMLMAPYLLHGKKEGRTEVCVRYKNLQNGTEFVWEKNKFINRKYLMQEMYQNYAGGDSDWDVPQEKDPFWEDPNTEVLIGTVHVYLQSLAYLIELEETLRISDFKGNEQGFLQVDVRPCSSNGDDLGEDEFIDKPDELVGKALNFTVNIVNCRGLSSRFSSSYCQYKMYLDSKYVKTEEQRGINPDYGHKKMFSFSPVTTQFKDYLCKEALVLELWGRQKVNSKQAGAALNTKELMVRERSTARAKTPVVDTEYKAAAQATVYKRRLERAEGKLKKLQELVDNLKNKKQTSCKIEDVESCLNSGNMARFRATADIIKIIEKAKQENPENVTSQACVLQ